MHSCVPTFSSVWLLVLLWGLVHALLYSLFIFLWVSWQQACSYKSTTHQLWDLLFGRGVGNVAGGYPEDRQKVLDFFLKRPDLETPVEITKEQHRELAYKQLLAIVREAGVNPMKYLMEDPGQYFALLEAVGYIDMSLAIKLGVQFRWFLNLLCSNHVPGITLFVHQLVSFWKHACMKPWSNNSPSFAHSLMLDPICLKKKLCLLSAGQSSWLIILLLVEMQQKLRTQILS